MSRYPFRGLSVRVLILDIDGVLNSKRSELALGNDGHFPRDAMRVSERRRDFQELRDTAKFDPIAVGILRRILLETQCKVVLSTTWRLMVPIEDFNQLFLAYDLPLVIIDKTGKAKPGATIRGREIQMWLDNHPEVSSYLILDDEALVHSYQLEHLIQTDPKIGLNIGDYETIIQRWPICHREFA
jgi:hypothetical protein